MIRRLLLATALGVVFLALLGFSVGEAGEAGEPDALWKQAEQLTRENKRDEAIAGYREFIGRAGKDPRAAVAYERIGALYRAMEKWQEAHDASLGEIAFLEKLDRGPEQARQLGYATYWLAYAQQRLGKDAEARAGYAKLIRSFGGDAGLARRALWDLLWSHEEDGTGAAALDAVVGFCKEQPGLTPHFADASRDFCFRSGRAPAVIEVYRKLLALDLPEAIRREMLVRLIPESARQGVADEGRKALAALRASPGTSDAERRASLLAEARFRKLTGCYEAAVGLYKAYLDGAALKAATAVPAFEAAQAFLAAGLADEALGLLEKLRPLSGGRLRADVLTLLRVLYLRRSDWAGLKGYYEEVLDPKLRDSDWWALATDALEAARLANAHAWQAALLDAMAKRATEDDQKAALAKDREALEPWLGKVVFALAAPAVAAADDVALQVLCINNTEKEVALPRVRCRAFGKAGGVGEGALDDVAVPAAASVQRVVRLPLKTPGEHLLVVDTGGGEEVKLPFAVVAAARPVTARYEEAEAIELGPEQAAVLWNVRRVAEEGQGAWLVPAEAGPAYVEFVIEVPRPQAGPPRVQFALEAALEGVAPQLGGALLYEVDGRGRVPRAELDPQTGQVGLPRVFLTPGRHSLRVWLTTAEGRLRKVALVAAPGHLLGGVAAVEAPYGMVYQGEEARGTVRVQNGLPSEVAYPVEYRLVDPRGEVAFAKKWTARAEANGEWSESFTFRAATAGLLEGQLRIHTPHGVAVLRRRVAVIFQPVEGFRPDSPFLVTHGDSEALGRLGVKWSRWELSWSQMEPERGRYAWAEMDRRVAVARKSGILVDALLSHAPPWALPLGKRTPAHRRGDDSPGPAFLKDYEEFCFQFARRYGEVVRAYQVWNEPWEGGGISGWGASGAHYRELQRALWRGIKRADPKLLAGGNDSLANIQDNFLGVPGFEKFWDFATIHTTTQPQWMGSQNAAEALRGLGKPVWDTESWADPMATVQTHCLNASHGVVKSSPYNFDHLFQDGELTVWGLAYNVLIHFLEDKAFHKEVRPECLPYILVFKGEKGAVAVVVGQLWGDVTGNPWDQIEANGEMLVADPGGDLEVTDEYGSRLPRRGPREVVVPLSRRPFYVTTRGKVEPFLEALEKATTSGFTPVQIAVADLTQPLVGAVREPPLLRVLVSNPSPEPISGVVRVVAPEGLTLAEKELRFTDLAGGKQAELAFTVRDGQPNPTNTYPVRIEVETPRGKAEHREPVAVACIARGTPVIDGNVSEWEALGAIPVTLRPNRTGIDYWSAARYMWMEAPDFKTAKDAFARVAFLWDDDCLYLMARVKAKGVLSRGSMRSPTRYEMLPPPCDYAYKKIDFAGGGLQIAIDCVPNADAFYPIGHPYERRWGMRRTDYEYGIYATQDFGPELWRFLAPGIRWHHAYPFSPLAAHDQGVVEGVRASLHYDQEAGAANYEVAIPLAELRELKPAEGKVIRLNFLIPDVGHWSEGRSTCKLNAHAFHPGWAFTYSCETEWRFIGPRPR